MGPTLEKRYEFESGGYALMASPQARVVEMVLKMGDTLSRAHGPAVVERGLRTLRIRMYLRELELGGENRTFAPIAELMDNTSMQVLMERMLGSLSFAGEVVYNMLDGAAEDFRTQIQEAAVSEVPESQDETAQFARRALERKRQHKEQLQQAKGA